MPGRTIVYEASLMIYAEHGKKLLEWPFDKEPSLPLGITDSPEIKVTPASLYLTQLEERLGKQALKNIGY